jgi:hypothetical protein
MELDAFLEGFRRSGPVDDIDYAKTTVHGSMVQGHLARERKSRRFLSTLLSLYRWYVPNKSYVTSQQILCHFNQRLRGSTLCLSRQTLWATALWRLGGYMR